MKRFANTFEFCNGDTNKFILLLRKGVYPYEYVDSWERFNETALPYKHFFHGELKLEDITHKDYTHAQKVFKQLKLKNLMIIKTCMFKPIYYCLLMYLKTLETNFLIYMNLILLIFCLPPRLPWQACLKRTEVKLELLTDIDILLMVEKGTRGGIYHAIHRYTKANKNI